MVTRRVSEDLLAAAKSSLTRRVTSSLLRFAAIVSAVGLTPKRLKRSGLYHGLKLLTVAVAVCEYECVAYRR